MPIIYESYLCHHGIKGMKWGHRKQREPGAEPAFSPKANRFLTYRMAKKHQFKAAAYKKYRVTEKSRALREFENGPALKAEIQKGEKYFFNDKTLKKAKELYAIKGGYYQQGPFQNFKDEYMGPYGKTFAPDDKWEYVKRANPGLSKKWSQLLRDYDSATSQADIEWRREYDTLRGRK